MNELTFALLLIAFVLGGLFYWGWRHQEKNDRKVPKH